jgi:hypothetical protein
MSKTPKYPHENLGYVVFPLRSHDLYSLAVDYSIAWPP